MFVKLYIMQAADDKLTQKTFLQMSQIIVIQNKHNCGNYMV